MKQKWIYTLFCLIILVVTSGCVTIGNRLPLDYARKIVINQTTRSEIEKNIGTPYRTGLDSGDLSATYLYYRIGLFIHPKTTDLTIVYNNKGIVKSYIFNSNEKELESSGTID